MSVLLRTSVPFSGPGGPEIFLRLIRNGATHPETPRREPQSPGPEFDAARLRLLTLIINKKK
jgi:hypothetical protein